MNGRTVARRPLLTQLKQRQGVVQQIRDLRKTQRLILRTPR